MSTTAQPADAAGQAAINAQVAAAKTSFYWAMRFLPKARREAMFSVYAFCREVDDIADSEDAPEAKLAALAGWRREIDALYEGTPRLPLSRALADVIRSYDLRRADFIAIIAGMEMDAAADITAPTLAELDLYCDRVACAVGRISAKIFGAPQDEGDRVANALGRALQLTNILRDLAEDAARGRLYLPSELLDKYGIAERAPSAVLAHRALSKVCEEIAVLARRRYAEAGAAMKACPPGTMRPARVMGAVYADILARLEKRGWRRIDDRVGVPAPVKLWYALRYGLL
jgi:presqualene diphosphate synthase